MTNITTQLTKTTLIVFSLFVLSLLFITGIAHATSTPIHIIADSNDNVLKLEENSGGEFFEIDVDSGGNLIFLDDAGAKKFSISDAGSQVSASVFSGLFDEDTFLQLANDIMEFWAGNFKFLTLSKNTQNTFVINDDSGDVDFRIESDTNANAFFLEGATGNVGIGTSSPDNLLHIYATGMATVELEGQTNNALFIINSNTDNVGRERSEVIFQDNSVNRWLVGKSALDDFHIYDSTRGGDSFRIKDNGDMFLMESGGNVGIASTTTNFNLAVGNSGMNSGDTTFTNTSHSSFKEKISDFMFPDNFLEMFRKVKVKVFKYKDDYAEKNHLSTEMRTGLLADEFNPLIGLDSSVTTLSGDDRMNVMHEAIRLLIDKNEKLEARIAELEELMSQN